MSRDSLMPLRRRAPHSRGATRPWSCRVLGCLVALMFTANAALAIQPARWVHTTEADFQGGEAVDAVVTNLGDIKLAHRTSEIGDSLEQASIIYDMHRIGDDLYIAAGPQAKLLKRTGDETTVIFESETEQLFCLGQDAAGKLLLGLSGEKCRIALLDGEEVKEVFNLNGVRYIWDMIIHDGKLILATGVEGKLLSVTIAEGQPAVTALYDAKQANLLCLGVDGKGNLYAGSDTDGLVYRITLTGDAEKPAEVFVVYDAAEPEIGAMLVKKDGTVYAGTADAEQARPGRLEKAATEETGRAQIAPEGAADEGGGEGDAPQPPPSVPPQPEPINPPDAAPEGDAEPAPMPSEPETITEESAQAAEAPAGPTPQQRDALRAEIRRRLIAARESGRMQVSSAPRRIAGSTAAGRRSTGARPAEQRKKGNAVYRIDPDGFVREVFRESVMVLALGESDGRLLVSTGNEGQIFSIDVEAQETTILADLKPAQVPAMLLDDNGAITLGTANPARLIGLEAGYADEGSFTSDSLDAAQISKWGTLAVTGKIPDGSTIVIRTRSGNVADPDEAAWSPWSEPVTLGHDENMTDMSPRYVPVTATPARFLQYEAKLTSGGEVTPVLDRVEITYVVPNLAPQVESIKAAYPEPKKPSRSTTPGDVDAEPPAPETVMKIEWKAADPNGDDLVYALEYQMAGSDLWLTLDDGLDQERYEWETRRMPDGRYRLRVVASDRPDNPADAVKTATRLSDPLLVDNTPPTFEDVSIAGEAGEFKLAFKVSDALSPVAAVHYALDGSDQWQVVMPADWIMDSTTESFVATIAGLSPGRHAVTLRATDERGNAAYKALFLNAK